MRLSVSVKAAVKFHSQSLVAQEKLHHLSRLRENMPKKSLFSPRLLLFLLKYTATPSPLPRFTCLEVPYLLSSLESQVGLNQLQKLCCIQNASSTEAHHLSCLLLLGLAGSGVDPGAFIWHQGGLPIRYCPMICACNDNNPFCTKDTLPLKFGGHKTQSPLSPAVKTQRF